MAALDERLAHCAGLFHVYRECRGELLQPRPGQETKTVRIDRLLTPTTALVALGWRHGAIGIEVKRSGEKIGQPLAQMHDYIRSVWVLPGGTKVWLDWVFLWPLEEQAGTVASIMTQGRLGSAIPHNWSWLKLYSGQVKVIRVDRNGTVELGDGKTGLRCGSR